MGLRQHPQTCSWRGVRRTGKMVLVIIVLLGPAATALAADDGGVAGEFLRFGASARSLALANAVCGVADDVGTSYYNPAGLALLRTMEITGMGATIFEDTRYSFFTLGLPTENWGAFALSGAFLSSGGFERADPFLDLDETFKEQEHLFTVSYARGSGRLAYGFTIKTVGQDIGGVSGSGSGVDLGLYFRPHRNISLGGSLQNVVAPEITLDQQPEKLARSGQAGVALHFFRNRLQMTSDLVKTEYMAAGLRSGLELWPLRALAVRGGYDSIREQLTAGLGVRWENWQFDYAFVDGDLGAMNIMSATLRFGVPYGVKLGQDHALFSPSGADRAVKFAIATAVRGRVESWQLVITDHQGTRVQSFGGNGEPPPDITWDGADHQGRLVADGQYEARVLILDDLGQEWEFSTGVEVLGFQDRTRSPIRLEVSGGGSDSRRGRN
ncbi:MAG: PorV/PorQ family protein [bacterium]